LSAHCVELASFAVRSDGSTELCDSRDAATGIFPSCRSVFNYRKYADLIAVDGNVLSEIKKLEHVRFVMKGGEVVRNDYRKAAGD
jgi:hypothetical protein